MLRKIILTALFLPALRVLFFYDVQAQDNNPLINNSGEIIQTALQFEADTNWTEAIRELRKIPVNDTNYYYAMTELANSYSGARKYDSAVILCRRFLKEPNPYHTIFYVALGNSLDAMEQRDESVAALKEGIQKYPNDHLLHYNLGITYNSMKKYPDAMASFQRASELNPFHSGSHLLLGILYLKSRQMVPAMLSLSTFLLVNPGSSKAMDVVVLLEKVAQLEYKDEEDNFILTLPAGEDDFSEQETIIRSKIALNSKYKSQSKLNYDILKQLQVLFEKLEPQPDPKGFCMKNYVPLYSDLFKKDYFETFSYYILSSSDNPDIRTWNKKNQKKSEDFILFAVSRMREISAQNPVTVNGKQYFMQHWTEKGRLNAIGNLNSGGTSRSGQWFFFNDNGTLSKEGSYDNAGKENGEWKFYYETGELSEIHNYKGGVVEGSLKTYYESGVMGSDLQYVNNQLSGTVKTYHPTGQLNRQFEIKNGMREGKFSVFDQNGGKEEEGSYKNSELDGNYKSFFRNGSVKVDCNYTAGKLTGNYTSHFLNGNKYLEGKYSNGEPSGTFKYYFNSGKVREERSFTSDGKPTGTRKTYHEDGTKNSETTYDNSGMEETYKEYDEDGKLWMTIGSKAGKINEVVFYDKQGGVIVRNERTRSLSPVKAHYPGGELFYKGQLKNDERTGKWETWYSNGSIKEIENYDDEGKMEGVHKFYNRDGSLQYEEYYKEDLQDGYFKSYYHNGKVYNEGWYEKGERSGIWLGYNSLGTLTSKTYYIAGVQTGRQEYYNDLGKLYNTEVIKNELLARTYNHDTLGSVITTNEIKDGSGSLNPVFFNGKARAELTLKNGWLQGPARYFHMNGKMETEGAYKNDLREGEWKSYDNAGKLQRVTNYAEDEPEGEWTTYENEKLHSVEYYRNGNEDSIATWYFPSGKTEQTVTYKNGQRHGPIKIYNEEGQLYIILNYEHDNIISYSYMGADGKPVEEIQLPKETGKVTTYFPNKKKAMEGEYRSGLRQGKFTRYTPAGTVAEERIYKDNALEGTWKKWNAAGKLTWEESYTNGDMHGTCKYYYDDGKIMRIANYYLDEPHGEWKYYDKAGKVTKKETYYLGELVN